MEGGAGGAPNGTVTQTTTKLCSPDEFDRAETILVVEDEAAVRRVICLTLEMQGYRVLAAENAAHALRFLSVEGSAVELLLIDVILPGTSGPQLCEAVRSVLGDIPVLFVSGYGGDVLASHGVTSTDNHFLAKPFTSATLGRKLRQLLRAGPQ